MIVERASPAHACGRAQPLAVGTAPPRIRGRQWAPRHLFRNRRMRIACAFLVVNLRTWYFSFDVYSYLTILIRDIFIFDVPVRVVLYIGKILIAMPVKPGTASFL